MIILELSCRVVAALGLACVLLHASYALARRIVPDAAPAMRWTAVSICGLWLATVGFQILISIGEFRLSVALALAVAVLIGTRICGFSASDCRAALRQEIAAIPRFRGFAAFVAVVTSIVLLSVAFRALLVPVVAWDSMTYHALKAALWVQRGGAIDLVAPGGWSIYQSYPGGAEALQAWAMLPFHGDLLVGVVDGFQWLAMGVAMLALGGELGLSKSEARIGTVYVLLLPAAARAVGSLYVDIPLALALIAAAALAAHGIRVRGIGAVALSIVALGLAVGIKAFALPVAAILPFAAILCVRRELRSVRNVAWIAGGLLAAATVSVPWFVENWRRTDYPVSPIPLQVLGVTLGETNEAMRWYLDRPEIESAGIADEVDAAARMFGVPGFTNLDEPTLGILTILSILVFLPGLVALLRTRLSTALIVVAVSAPVLLSFYGEGLRATRLIWAAVSGRYLLGALAPMVLVGFLAGAQGGVFRRLYGGLLVLGAALMFVVSDLAGWRPIEAIPAFAASATAVALFMGAQRVPAPRGRMIAGIALLIVFATPFGLAPFRAQTRSTALAESVVLHASPRYMVPAWRAVNDDSARHIAITSGPARDADNWLVYPFLGSRLQHTIDYVPVSSDGTIPAFARYDEMVATADYPSWIARLDERGITDVVCFAPRSLELVWMERRPEQFQRIAGDGGRWGLYRIIR